MKRISLGVVLLILTPGITEAYYGCGVHYSPYALSYHNSGLVSCDVQYTPYALSYYNSGLVYDYGICYYGGGSYPIFSIPYGRGVFSAPRPSSPARHWAQATSGPKRPPVCREPRRPDCLDVIRQHLHTRGFASVSVDRIYRVDNELLSVDVRVKDLNLLIKYWNPEQVQRLSEKEAYKLKAYAKYKQDWEQFAEQYKQTGGEIYTINAATPETIVAALDSCTKLAPGQDATGQHVLYAKN